MAGRTVAITGANKGIGFETARQLGRLGDRIWLGSRDATRGGAAAERLSGEGLDVRCLPPDVTRDESVKDAAALVEEDGTLDVLINNAGIPNGQRTPPSRPTVDDVRTVYETNVFGPIRVTRAFPLLPRGAGTATVVMVSSGLGSLGWPSDPEIRFYGVDLLGYNGSKSALDAVTVSFAKELAPLGIRVNAADPGYTATDLNGHSGYRTVEQAAAGIVRLAGLHEAGRTGGFCFERVTW